MMRWGEILTRIPERAIVAEVGVWRGALSGRLLASGKLACLYLVDPWEPGTPGTPWWESASSMARFPRRRHEAAFRGVRRLAKAHAGVARIIRRPSVEAATEVPDGSLDLAFLDGDHSREGLAQDIQAWRPKIRPGGWIGGHDFDCPKFPEVRKAVEAAFGGDYVVGADTTWWRRMW